jgi:hypothetical protein
MKGGPMRPSARRLFYRVENNWKKLTDRDATRVFDFAEGYKKFLNKLNRARRSAGDGAPREAGLDSLRVEIDKKAREVLLRQPRRRDRARRAARRLAAIIRTSTRCASTEGPPMRGASPAQDRLLRRYQKYLVDVDLPSSIAGARRSRWAVDILIGEDARRHLRHP